MNTSIAETGETPWIAIHDNNHGQTAYIVYSQGEPSKKDVIKVLEEEFDESNDDITIHPINGVSELCGIAPEEHLPLYVLEVYRYECINPDVWYFNSKEEAEKASSYAIDVFQVERTHVKKFYPNPKPTVFDAFKAEIGELDGHDYVESHQAT